MADYMRFLTIKLAAKNFLAVVREACLITKLYIAEWWDMSVNYTVFGAVELPKIIYVQVCKKTGGLKTKCLTYFQYE